MRDDSSCHDTSWWLDSSSDINAKPLIAVFYTWLENAYYRKIQKEIIRAQGVRYSSNSELEILIAGSPVRFSAFQASNPLKSEAAASQKKKEKLTTN